MRKEAIVKLEGRDAPPAVSADPTSADRQSGEPAMVDPAGTEPASVHREVAAPAAGGPVPPLRAVAGFVDKTLVIAELEARKLRHDPTELITRAVQPALWLLVF